MKVNPREIESLASVAEAQPEPVYRDQTVTVYGIPLFHTTPGQSTDAPDPTTIQPLLSKRRRSNSSTFTTKRQRIAEGGPRGSPQTPIEQQTLAQRSQTPDFMPCDLRGQEAQDWRRLLISSMFPCNGEPRNVSSTSCKGKAEAWKPQDAPNAVTSNPNDGKNASNRNIAISPRSKGRRLPPISGVNSSNKLCYVCVGPKVRGKFDVEKATQLGVPKGRIRGQLTQGHTITFMVDDGKGGQVERTVRPEEIVSPPEASRVCNSHSLAHLSISTLR